MRLTLDEKRSPLKWAGWALLLLGVALLVGWSARLVRTGLSLRQHLARAQALADAPDAAEPEAACELVADLRGDVVALRREAGGLARLAPLLGWLPWFGGDLRAAPHLLAVADGLTEAGALSCEALGPALGQLGTSGGDSAGFSPEQMAALLAQEQAKLGRALQAVERADAAWAQVETERLSPWLAGKSALLDQGLPLLRSGLAAAVVAPDLLGVNEPRTYLVLALNEDELRPGGGFITGVGELRVEAGRLVHMDFRDSYKVDDFSQPYPDPPEPLARYMGIDQWVFRDSNWSPDFPTAARQAISLYRPGHPVEVDGLIALDQRAVEGLVDALGPLYVEGSAEPLTGDTVITFVRGAWAPEDGELTGKWWQQRKSFMGTLAEAAWGRVKSGRVDWTAMAEVLLRLIEEKHLLIYVEHPQAARVLAEQGWDGALPPRSSDFLMVVDANVGYNKASARVREEMIYQVDLRPSPPRAKLTLIYTHTASGDYPCRPEVRYDPVYERMMDRCYWDYVRVYVPEGSELLDATRIPVPGEALFGGQAESGAVAVGPAEEGLWQALGVLALIPPSVTQTRSFTWTLPSDVVEWRGSQGRYALRVQKQPGAPGRPVTVDVLLPEGVSLLGASPEPAMVGEGWLTYRVELDRDREFRIYFRREP